MSKKTNKAWVAICANINPIRNEVLDIYCLGVDNRSLSLQARNSTYIPESCGYTPDELPEGRIDWKAFRDFVIDYDIIVTDNAFQLGPIIAPFVPSKKQRKEEKKGEVDICMACAKTMLGVDITGDVDQWKYAKYRVEQMLKTIKKAGVEALVATQDTRYHRIYPLANLISPELMYQLTDNGFVLHKFTPIKYVESSKLGFLAYDFKFASSAIPRHHLFLKTVGGEE